MNANENGLILGEGAKTVGQLTKGNFRLREGLAWVSASSTVGQKPLKAYAGSAKLSWRKAEFLVSCNGGAALVMVASGHLDLHTPFTHARLGVGDAVRVVANGKVDQKATVSREEILSDPWLVATVGASVIPLAAATGRGPKAAFTDIRFAGGLLFAGAAAVIAVDLGGAPLVAGAGHLSQDALHGVQALARPVIGGAVTFLPGSHNGASVAAPESQGHTPASQASGQSRDASPSLADSSLASAELPGGSLPGFSGGGQPGGQAGGEGSVGPQQPTLPTLPTVNRPTQASNPGNPVPISFMFPIVPTSPTPVGPQPAPGSGQMNPVILAGGNQPAGGGSLPTLSSVDPAPAPTTQPKPEPKPDPAPKPGPTTTTTQPPTVTVSSPSSSPTTAANTPPSPTPPVTTATAKPGPEPKPKADTDPAPKPKADTHPAPKPKPDHKPDADTKPAPHSPKVK